MTFVKRFAIVEHMTQVTLSSKYQVVIPKEARKKMGIIQAEGQQFQITKVTEDEIVFRKAKSIDDYLGNMDDAFPKNPTAVLRRMRDTEWG